MTLAREDAAAIAASARRLGLDPRSYAALMQLESGIDPNVWGGGGGNYVGLIQFGPGARKEVGLPSGKMTIRDQLPYVEKYFSQRGYKPGEDPADNIRRAYRTVLVGNPHQSGTDSFGTNSDKAALRMLPGGDLYKTASSRLGDLADLDSLPSPSGGLTPSPSAPGETKPQSSGGSSFEEALVGSILGGSSAATVLGGMGEQEEPEGGSGSGETNGKPKTRFAAVELAPVGALAAVSPGRVAALKVPDSGSFDPTRARDNPVIAALGLEDSLPAESGSKEKPSSGQWYDAISGAWAGSMSGRSADKDTGLGTTSGPDKGTRASTGEIGLVDLGKRLQGLGFKVAEHPEFGGVGEHSEGSHHYAGNALDLTIQAGSPLLKGRKDEEWRALTKEYGARLKQAFPTAEILYPGDPGHDQHIHIAFPKGRKPITELARKYGFA